MTFIKRGELIDEELKFEQENLPGFDAYTLLLIQISRISLVEVPWRSGWR
jgi:hypothetical protein